MDTRVLEAHSGPVYTVEFNKDTSFIASGGKDKNLIIWDVNTLGDDDNNEITYYNEMLHKSAITSLKWSQLEDQMVYTSGADMKCFAFDLNKGQKVKTFTHNSYINQIDVSKRDIISTVCDGGQLKLFEMRSKEPIGEISTSYPLLTTVLDPTETYVYFSGVDPTVCCYDLRRLELPQWKECIQKKNVTSLDISGNGEYLISKSIDGSIKYFDSRHLQTIKTRGKPYVFEGPTSSDEDWLIRSKIVETEGGMYTVYSGSNNGFLHSWDFATRKAKSQLNYNSGTIFDLDIKCDKLVTASLNGSLILSSL